jgi:uncharacterized protein (TIGR01777 family)
MSELKVTVTGATGLIGRRLLERLLGGDIAEVTVLTRDPANVGPRLGHDLAGRVQAIAWDPLHEPAPAEALSGRDAVVHLAGENISQRWSKSARTAIRESRVQGTHNLVEGLKAAESRPGTLVSGSAIGYYGPHGIEPVDEDAPAGSDFLAEVCAAWEAAAAAAGELGMRVVHSRTGVVLDQHGGALSQMLLPFKLGVGGPIAGGGQYLSWIHADDVIGILIAALTDERWSGPINVTAPEPVSNRDFSKALGSVLKRPAVLPLPGAALHLLYGDMAEIITTGVRAMPARALVLGYEFRQPELRPALLAALDRS